MSLLRSRVTYNLESGLLVVTGSSSFVLTSGGIELVAYGCNEPAAVVIVPLPYLYMMIVDQITVAAAVKQILTSQLDTQTVIEESLYQTDAENSLMVVVIDVLLMACALIIEIEFTIQGLTEGKGIVELYQGHRLIQFNIPCCCFHREPLFAHTE